jgi:hypothetical protein
VTDSKLDVAIPEKELVDLEKHVRNNMPEFVKGDIAITLT